jgi:cytoskeletal protein CcmA (bactofilin family)
MAIGRISGPLLKENLVRDGVDLAFETDLLYLDVNNARIGIRNSSPTADLDVSGTTKTTNLIVSEQAEIGNFIITGSSITSTTNVVNFTASLGSATVYQNKLLIDDISIVDNTISTEVSNSNLVLRPSGSGKVVIESNTDVNGDLDVDGDINVTGSLIINGNTVIGNNSTEDTITINAEIASNLNPSTDNLYNVGSLDKKWKNLYSTNLTVETEINVGSFTFSSNTISVADNNIVFDTDPGYATIFNSILSVDDIEIKNNLISTVVSNSPLQINANGSGSIELESNTRITGNLVVSGDITANGNVVIGGNIQLGDESSDSIQINARIDSDLIPVSDGVYSLGEPGRRWQDVYAVNFYTTEITLPNLTIGNLIFNNNAITSVNGQNIVIDGAGTGGVQLANFRIVDSVITNVVPNDITTIQQSGTGYFKIATNNGFVMPLGNTSQRPTSYAVLGMTRYNTDTRAIEVWNGSTFASPAGVLGAVSEAIANDIAAAFAIALG